MCECVWEREREIGVSKVEIERERICVGEREKDWCVQGYREGICVGERERFVCVRTR